MGSSSIVLMVIGVVIAVAVVATLIVVYLKKANARYAQLWGALTPLVNGSSKGSKMTGSYEGKALEARIRTAGDEGTEYYFNVALTDRPLGKDWSLEYTGDKLLGLGTKAWRVKTKDEALKQRLIDGGLVGLLESWPAQPKLSYEAKNGKLEYDIRIKNSFQIPGADEFQQQLRLLQNVSRVNQQMNVA